MELTLLSDSKLKVHLSKDELVGFSLTCETIDYENTETKYALWSILKEAKYKTGFDTSREKLYIRVYPQPGGGCDMFVTKLKNSVSAPALKTKHEPSAEPAALLPAKTNRHESAYSVSKLKISRQIYSFSTLETLLGVCKKLSDIGYRGSSSVYHDDTDGSYYLIISICESASDNPTNVQELKFAFIGEYSEPCISTSTSLLPLSDNFGSCYSYIIEHCTVVCSKDAVGILSAFALMTSNKNLNR